MGRTGVVYKDASPEIETLKPLAVSKAKALLAEHGEEWLCNHIFDRAMIRLREKSVQPLRADVGRNALLDCLIEQGDPEKLNFSGHIPVVEVCSTQIPSESFYQLAPTAGREMLTRSKRGATEIELGRAYEIKPEVKPSRRDAREDKSTWIPLAPIKS